MSWFLTRKRISQIKKARFQNCKQNDEYLINISQYVAGVHHERAHVRELSTRRAN
jgi:hypothetical protein